jgi:hypothetical protein
VHELPNQDQPILHDDIQNTLTEVDAISTCDEGSSPEIGAKGRAGRPLRLF